MLRFKGFHLIKVVLGSLFVLGPAAIVEVVLEVKLRDLSSLVEELGPVVEVFFHHIRALVLQVHIVAGILDIGESEVVQAVQDLLAVLTVL